MFQKEDKRLKEIEKSLNAALLAFEVREKEQADTGRTQAILKDKLTKRGNILDDKESAVCHMLAFVVVVESKL